MLSLDELLAGSNFGSVENQELRRRVRQLVEEHYPVMGSNGLCYRCNCGQDLPCPTVETLEGRS